MMGTVDPRRGYHMTASRHVQNSFWDSFCFLFQEYGRPGREFQVFWLRFFFFSKKLGFEEKVRCSEFLGFLGLGT